MALPLQLNGTSYHRALLRCLPHDEVFGARSTAERDNMLLDPKSYTVALLDGTCISMLCAVGEFKKIYKGIYRGYVYRHEKKDIPNELMKSCHQIYIDSSR